ncbi:MAG: exodeoxyribonuclease VII large subunit [Clostridiales bacterium]|nr:exodeoxyribonuclease VII large subunit [Clostridiales bacterium]
MAAQEIFSVSQVNQYIKGMLDQDRFLGRIYIRGEISNYKRYPSGHHYFSLKDEGDALKCVMFRSAATRLRFQPESGMKVIAFGRVTVYPRDGVYQLYVEALSPDGIGELYVAFEQLKARLEAEGLFDEAHKKPLPAIPERIGVITSEAGAAVHDIIRVLRARWPLCEVRLLPVRVQGAEAPAEIASAIAYANRWKVADVLIVGRGGGSMEDLWAFNDERVARAIYASELPIISAVGHEPDVTIADFVADRRAATPSNGAELAVPDWQDVYSGLTQLDARQRQAVLRRLQQARAAVERCDRSQALKNPYLLLESKQMELDRLTERLGSAAEKALNRQQVRLASLTAGLDAMSPLKVLSRGYSVTRNQAGAMTSVQEAAVGDELSTTLSDGTLTSVVTAVNEGRKGAV